MTSRLVQIDGWLRPPRGSRLTAQAAASVLRQAGVPGAVGAPDSRGVLPVALLAEGWTPSRVPGSSRLLVDALGEATTASGIGVMLEDGVFIGDDLPEIDDPSVPETPDDGPPDVLLGRLDPEMLPLLAHHVGSPLRWEQLEDGVVLVQLEERGAQLQEEAFLRPELPVVALTTLRGQRYCSVLLKRGLLPGHLLTRQQPWVPTYGPEVAHPGLRAALPALDELHLTPDETVRSLVDSVLLPGCEETALRAALASPGDDAWSARVLAALGLPTVAADVHEGRAVVAGTYVTPQKALPTLTQAVGRSIPRTADEMRQHGRGGRLVAASLTRPALALLWILPQLLLALALTLWVAGADPRAWWHWLLALVALAAWFGAVTDTVTMVRALVRRRRPSDPPR